MTASAPARPASAKERQASAREPLAVRRERVNRLLRQADEAMRTGGRGIDVTHLSEAEFRQLMERAAQADD